MEKKMETTISGLGIGFQVQGLGFGVQGLRSRELGGLRRFSKPVFLEALNLSVHAQSFGRVLTAFETVGCSPKP